MCAILKQQRSEAKSLRRIRFEWRGLAGVDPGVQGVQRKEKDGLENSIEQGPGDDQTEQGKVPGMLHPVDVALGDAFRHHHHDPRVAIERRHGQQVERAQKQIQNEEDAQSRSEKRRIRRIGRRLPGWHNSELIPAVENTRPPSRSVSQSPPESSARNWPPAPPEPSTPTGADTAAATPG